MPKDTLNDGASDGKTTTPLDTYQHSNKAYDSRATPCTSDVISNNDNPKDESQVDQDGNCKPNATQEDQDDVVMSCGWGSVTPPCGQRLMTVQTYLVVLTVCGCVAGMAINGLVNTALSTLERRFGLSSTESGLIASCYDIMFVILVGPITYFGGRGHKPRYIGVGMLILGVGSFVFSIPHFATGAYTVGDAEEAVCDTGLNTTDRCGTETTQDSSLSNYKYVFYAGQLMQGAGAIALLTLGITYCDENVHPRKSSFYNGIFWAGQNLGPAIGYMVGGFLLDIYTDTGVDPASLGLDTHNPRWVGAWWIGFLGSGTVCVLLSIPMLAFPKTLPGHQEYASERGKEVQAQKHADATGQSQGLRDVWLSVKLLLTNWPFVFISLASAAITFLIGGFSAFLPKYLEYQFGVSASTAALYLGIIIVPCGGGATLAGGLIIKFFDLKIRGILRFCIGSAVLLVLSICVILITCDPIPFAGVSLPYGAKYEAGKKYPIHKHLDASCNAGCGCGEEDYRPMCGADGVLYFSPCYAGCTSIMSGGVNQDTRYANCSCVNQTNPDSSQGTFGKCDKPCDKLTLFNVLLGVQICLIFITTMPVLTATLRCVPYHQRSFSLGLQWIVARSLGFLPGPILFGKMFDLVCVVWQKRCHGGGSCFFYDNDRLSMNLLVLAGVFSGVAASCFIAALCLYQAAPILEPSDKVTDTLPCQSTVST